MEQTVTTAGMVEVAKIMLIEHIATATAALDARQSTPHQQTYFLFVIKDGTPGCEPFEQAFSQLANRRLVVQLVDSNTGLSKIRGKTGVAVVGDKGWPLLPVEIGDALKNTLCTLANTLPDTCVADLMFHVSQLQLEAP